MADESSNPSRSPSASVPAAAGRRQFWRTLEEREAGAVPSEPREFEPEVFDPELPTNVVSRRGFLGMFGATAALATAACTSHDRTIVPYTKRPPEVIPGIANYYATTFPEGVRSYPVLVKTREGRPIHVTGNDEHPRFKGKTSPRAIADLSALYDPDRARAPRFENRPSNWGEVATSLTAALAAAKRDGTGVLLLTGASDSPSRNALLAQLKASVPTLDIVQWEPAESDNARVASKMTFGDSFEVRPNLRDAEVIVALAADFLNGEDPVAIGEFTAKRRPDRPGAAMSRLWAFEGTLSLTGANADERVPVRPSQIPLLAWALVRDLQAKGGVALPAGVIVPALPEDVVQKLGIGANRWDHLVADLSRARQSALVLSGAEIAPAGHVAAHVLNVMLQSAAAQAQPTGALAGMSEMQKLVDALHAGKYSVAIVWGANPAYAYPQSEQWSGAFAKVGTRFWIGCLPDETAAQCQWVLPSHHWLESWGDFGTNRVLTLQQPVIAPLYDSRQPEDIVLFALRGLGVNAPGDYRTYIRERWERDVKPPDAVVSFDQMFNAALHDGVVNRSGEATSSMPTLQVASVNEAARAALASNESDGFELVLTPGTQVYDGRYANNGWLQELPDPITKNTWGNPLLLGPEDAHELGLTNGDIAVVQVGGKSLRTPVIVQPGQARRVISLALGYGRTTGSVARGVGVNGFQLVALDSATPRLRTGAKLTNAHARVRLPLTQSHHRMEGRDLVRTFTPEQYASEVKQPRKKLEIVSLYPDQKFPEHRWAMSIDLSACVGCASCVLACQSENNVATVGPEQVERGREMHWIRIDSYYEGSETNPRVVHQPMLCQHCDDAPCENVCPVNATNHSSDGLNQMVYNRCVGTRYCANNCPYKVRRFNFFEYTADKKEPADLVYNPEVTVRPRGVMEKCTFCVQRIQDGRMRAKTEHRSVRDGDITPACAAACPSGAIVFGDLRDPQSRVSKLRNHSRAYKVLEELGTRPAVTYLANLKNPAVAGGSDE